jgi:hypothetical protein
MAVLNNSDKLQRTSSVRAIIDRIRKPSEKTLRKRAAKAHRRSLNTVLSTLPDSVDNKELHAQTLKAVLSEPLLNTAEAKDEHRRLLQCVNSTLPNSETNRAAHREAMAASLRHLDQQQSTTGAVLASVAAAVLFTFGIVAGAALDTADRLSTPESSPSANGFGAHELVVVLMVFCACVLGTRRIVEARAAADRRAQEEMARRAEEAEARRGCFRRRRKA